MRDSGDGGLIAQSARLAEGVVRLGRGTESGGGSKDVSFNMESDAFSAIIDGLEEVIEGATRWDVQVSLHSGQGEITSDVKVIYIGSNKRTGGFHSVLWLTWPRRR